jgi:FkbM family methyltransferase
MDRIDPAPDLIFDVGLHKGEDSAFYLAKGYRVVAFEAHAGLAAAARERFAAEIADGRLTIVEGAITDSDAATVRFFEHPNSVWGTTDPAWVERNLVVAPSTPVDVDAVDFAAQLRSFGMPHFLKIDIEGADLLCVETLRSFDLRPTYLSIESTQEDWAALEAEFDLLEALGYDRFAVVQQATIPGTRVRTTRRDGTAFDFEFEPDASGPFGPDVGPWLTREQALARYRRVFRAQRLLGPDSLVRRTRLGRGLRGQAARLTGRPLPGWYDTHAMRSRPSSP